MRWIRAVGWSAMVAILLVAALTAMSFGGARSRRLRPAKSPASLAVVIGAEREPWRGVAAVAPRSDRVEIAHGPPVERA
jgi:hypothetical protein